MINYRGVSEQQAADSWHEAHKMYRLAAKPLLSLSAKIPKSRNKMTW